MAMEPISPELALVDPELAARARATLADPAPAMRRSRSLGATHAQSAERTHRPYPFWARVTAALWLLVLGVLIGGAAIPHAQDTPRVIPPQDEITVCKPATQPTQPPKGPPGNGRPS
jgi:hypothetical protein